MPPTDYRFDSVNFCMHEVYKSFQNVFKNEIM